MFAFATPPGPELLVIVGLGAAAAGAGGAYPGLGFPVHIAPVPVVPAGTYGHIYLLH